VSGDRFGLTAVTIAKIAGVLARHAQVERAVLYGSRAMDNFQSGSDIDLTLIGPELKTHDLMTIIGELDDLLLPYMIDLSVLHQLTHQELIEHIQRVGKVFYERTPVQRQP
jgi:predicted nucleotidyltransferase